MEEIKQIIEKEIEENKQKYKDEWWVEQFNNFAFRLPDDDYEHGGYFRKIRKSRENKTHREDLEKEYPDFIALHSELYLNQTPREFFETIDETLKKEGISVDEIKRLQYLRNKNRNTEGGSKYWKTLYELVLPAYIKLRELGYNQHDLTA